MRHNSLIPGPVPSINAPKDTPWSPSKQARSMSMAVTGPQSPLNARPITPRPRTNSLPNPAFLLGYSGCRDPRTCSVSVRSFTTTSKGVVNAGDIKRKQSVNSLMSSGSAVPIDGRRKSSAHSIISEGSGKEELESDRPRAFSIASSDSSSSSGSPPLIGLTGPPNQAPSKTSTSYFRVVLQGDEGVGKTALSRQFSSSEYMGTYDTATAADSELTEKTVVPVLLDGEESIMEFIDGVDAYQLDDVNVDAYIVVFSIVDRNSYTVASDLVRQLRVNIGTDRAIILVGNKSDLVRKRQVLIEEARTLATTYDCKYIETSAALNHQVDVLVAGTLGQIRLLLAPPGQTSLLPPPVPKTRSRTPSPVSFFNKLFKRNAKGSSSCEGIFIQ